MSRFENWKATISRDDAQASAGRDLLSEAFNSAVNAFGNPQKLQSLGSVAANPSSTSKASAQRPVSSATPVGQDSPVALEQRNVVANPTIHHSPSTTSNTVRQQLPPLSQVVAAATQNPEQQDVILNPPTSASIAQPRPGQHRIARQSVISPPIADNVEQEPPLKRRRIVGSEARSGRASALPSIPADGRLANPQGAENCLSGCVFIFSGELPTLSRVAAKGLVERYGGQVTGAPDEHTTHAVLGHGVTRAKITILDRYRIQPLDEQGLVRLIEEMPANGGHWEESPSRDISYAPVLADDPVSIGDLAEDTAIEGAAQESSSTVRQSEGVAAADSIDRPGVTWPFAEPPNLVRHVPNPTQVQESGAAVLIKDEMLDVAPEVDTEPEVNRALRSQYAKAWGTPQVRRGELTKINFGVDYEKGEMRLIKHEIRRRGGKVVRISQAEVLVMDSHFNSIATHQTYTRYRPGLAVNSKDFLAAFPVLETLSFELQRDVYSATPESPIQTSSNGDPSRGIEVARDRSALIGPSTLTSVQQNGPDDTVPRLQSDRIARARAKYEDLIAQRDAFVAVRDRKIRRLERRRRNYYDSDSEDTAAIEQEQNNEERSFRPPSPAFPPIMDEVASDGYASSCDEHEIHRAILRSTKRMKPAKVKKGYLIQIKMVLRGPNGAAAVNAVNGKPGVTRTLRVPAATSFRQLADILNTAFGWRGDKNWDFLIASNAGKWSTVEPPPWQFVARVLKIVTPQTIKRVQVPDKPEAYFRSREVRLFDVWGRHQPRQCENLQVWYAYHSGIEWAHQISFLGEANDRLFEASRMEPDRKYWCMSGEGHAHPEDHPGKLDKWRGKTNLWAWDMAKINRELADLEDSPLHQ